MLIFKNNFKFLLVLCLAAMATSYGLSFDLNRAIAATDDDLDKIEQQQQQQQQIEPTKTIRNTAENSVLETLWQLLRAKRKQEPALSSRSNICEVTPGLLGETNLIYSDRPLFLWQGETPNLSLNLYSPFSLEQEQQIIWSQAIASNERKILYTGEALEPGKIYDWEIIADSAANRRRISFQVMSESQRDRISRELARRETELTNSGATTEEIALAKTIYFAERDLWSDALQIIYSLENYSSSLSFEAQAMIDYLCESTIK